MRKIEPSIIDQSALPALYPTHTHSPQFWEQLGRTVATFGFLEHVLGRAIYAFTATRIYSPDEIEVAINKWGPTLKSALKDTLKRLADSYGKAVKENQNANVENIDELVKSIKEAANDRDILCHASWHPPDAEGKSLPFFVNRKNEEVETKMDIEYLRRVQRHAADLALTVVETVTQMGWTFPGSE